ncbi:MAG: hypothetical protein IPO85_05430 [Saprospiraceae bacterium]|uniref:Uncharacterized protein n=1 Tax=Candidatus Defluviibacterium haderslevense TaxID=2981993 RepID=A0A9D7XCN0_9BACT|nr:hypothetical protein [Candidatus Defluviibacterium haderslevense]
MQQFSKIVAIFLQQIQDSSWTLKDATTEVQTHLLITCLFASGDYTKLPSIIQQFRKENKSPYTQKVGKAFIESYLSALPFKNDNNLFRKKYEEIFSSLFQKMSIEDLPRLEKNKTDAETASPEKMQEAFAKALPADTAKALVYGMLLP